MNFLGRNLWVLPFFYHQKGSAKHDPCTGISKMQHLQKALSWLKENNIAFEDRHLVEQNPSVEELTQWYHKSGLPLKKFFNTSGNLYKELGLKDKLPAMSEQEQLELLATNGMLVKRPLVVGENFVLTGFKEAEWEQLKG